MAFIFRSCASIYGRALYTIEKTRFVLEDVTQSIAGTARGLALSAIRILNHESYYSQQLQKKDALKAHDHSLRIIAFRSDSLSTLVIVGSVDSKLLLMRPEELIA